MPIPGTPTKSFSAREDAANSVRSVIDMALLTRLVAAAGLLMIGYLTANVIARAVEERTAEFGVLQAIGFTRLQLMGLVCAEAAIPCVLGAGIGACLAALLANLPNAWLPAGVRRSRSNCFCGRVCGRPRRCGRVGTIQLGSPDCHAVAQNAFAATGRKLNVSVLRQTLAVCRMNVMSAAERPGSALVVVLGVACVVGVMLSVLSVTAGLARAAKSGTDPRNAIVLASEAVSEDGSSVTRDTCSALIQAPGVAHGPDGRAIVDCELLQVLAPEGFAWGMLYIRGVGDRAWSLHPDFRIVAGRAFRPGRHELIVGTGALRIFNQKVGDAVIMPDGEWPIVGAFSSGGGVLEGQMLADAETLSASNRSNGFNSVLVRLESPEAFDVFARWIGENPGLAVVPERQAQFYLRSVESFTSFFTSLAYFIATILAIGALFGSLNVMYGRVRARTRELTTLRMFGFGAAPIAVSVLVEALLLCSLGAAIGSACAWLLFHGRHSVVVHTTFQFSLTCHDVLVGFAWAASVGLVGSLLPALRAARLPITEGLRG